jgi:hypothetical protein
MSRDATGQGQTYEVVRLHDPAIEWGDPLDPSEAKRAAKYREERDVTTLRFVDGKKPTMFRFRRLSRSDLRMIESRFSQTEKHELAFSRGVVEVLFSDGVIRRPAGTSWKDDELDLFDWLDIEDIGGVVLTRSIVPLDCAIVYAASGSCRDVSAANWVRQFAARNQESAVNPSEQGEAQ